MEKTISFAGDMILESEREEVPKTSIYHRRESPLEIYSRKPTTPLTNYAPPASPHKKTVLYKVDK